MKGAKRDKEYKEYKEYEEFKEPDIQPDLSAR